MRLKSLERLLTTSFGVLASVVLLVSVVAITASRNGAEKFAIYRDAALNSASMIEVNRQITDARRAAFRYRVTGSPDTVLEFRNAMDQLDPAITDAKALARSQTVVQLLDESLSLANDYRAAFDEYREGRAALQDVEVRLLDHGRTTRIELRRLISGGEGLLDLTSLDQLSRAQEALMLAMIVTRIACAPSWTERRLRFWRPLCLANLSWRCAPARALQPR